MEKNKQKTPTFAIMETHRGRWGKKTELSEEARKKKRQKRLAFTCWRAQRTKRGSKTDDNCHFIDNCVMNRLQ